MKPDIKAKYALPVEDWMINVWKITAKHNKVFDWFKFEYIYIYIYILNII